MGQAVCFYLFSAVLLTAAVLVVGSRQPVTSVLALLLAMFCLAALFVMLGAWFVAAIQILLYAGAVLVLFLFVIMLLNLAPEALARLRPFTLRGIGTVVGALFCVQLVGIVVRAAGQAGPTAASTWTVRDVARLLFTTYLLPFELTSFLILAAIIGAITLARGNK